LQFFFTGASLIEWWLISCVHNTLCLKDAHFIFGLNFYKSRPFFKILSCCLQERLPPHLNHVATLPCEVWNFKITAELLLLLQQSVFTHMVQWRNYQPSLCACLSIRHTPVLYQNGCMDHA